MHLVTNPKLWKDAASNTEPGQDSPLTIIISIAAGRSTPKTNSLKSTQSKCSENTILKFVSLLRFLWNLIVVQKPKQYFKTNHFPFSDVHCVFHWFGLGLFFA